MANTRKYVSLSKLSTFLDNLKNIFATKTEITSGTVVVKEAEHASTATTADSATTASTATSATTATQDASGNVITDTYETKADASAKLDEAKSYSDTNLATAKSYTDTKTSDLVSTSTVDNKISTHNTSTSAHNDIRDLIAGLTTRLNTLANSDDTTLDQMSEVVAYIKNNKSLIDGITTSKINVSDIVNNLTTNSTSKVLSAAQGVAIKELIDALELEVSYITNGTLAVGWANMADKAISDAGGQNISVTYETKTDASRKLAEAKNHGTSAASTAKTELIDGADVQHNTLKKLGDLIDDNKGDIDILYGSLGEKANKTHTHTITDVTNLQSTLNAKAAQTDLEALADVVDNKANQTDIPTKLPSPSSIVINGTSYDGSASVSVDTTEFVITFSDSSGTLTSDKTYTDALAAYNSGRILTAIYSGCRLPMTKVNSNNFEFSLIDAAYNKRYRLYFKSSGSHAVKTYTMSHKVTVGGQSWDGTADTDFTDTINSMIDAKDATHAHAIADVTNLQTTLDGKVPTSRTVNGKALSSNITLSASDVGAYTQDEVSQQINGVNTQILNIVTGMETVGKAEEATRAWCDASGNNIMETYATWDSLAEKADNMVATTSTDGLMPSYTVDRLQYGGDQIATTSGTGAAYTVNLDTIALKVGMSFIMIPHTVSTTTAPTLNVNGLGAKTIRRMVSNSSTSTAAGYNAGWLGANKPVRVVYNGTYWLVTDLTKPSAADMSGTLGVSNGGTGKTSVTAGSFLVGNGTSAMTEKTPAEVFALISATDEFAAAVNALIEAKLAEITNAEGVAF